jgi:hypothetical protein
LRVTFAFDLTRRARGHHWLAPWWTYHRVVADPAGNGGGLASVGSSGRPGGRLGRYAGATAGSERERRRNDPGRRRGAA